MFQHVQPQKYYMQIAKQIRDQIVEGKLRIGDKLPAERSLATQFGTSRASIREALSALEMLGIIECRSGQGNYIRADGSSGSIDGELLTSLLRGHDPYEIFEARLEIEPNMAALAAERTTADEKESLRMRLDSLNALSFRVLNGTATLSEILDDYMEEDRLFHLDIGRFAHNNVLFMVFAGVNFMMKETHWKGMKMKSIVKEGNLENYHQEHTRIFRAIWEGNGNAARKEMQEHIRVLQEDLF